MTAVSVLVAQPAAALAAPLESDDADSEPPQQQPASVAGQMSDFSASPSRQVTDPNLPRSSNQQQSPAASKTGLSGPSSPSSPVSISPVVQNLSPLTLSPSRPYPTVEVEIHATIPEEDDETDYDTPNEPVTPVSGRQSREGFRPAEPEPEPESAAIPKTESGAVSVPRPFSLSNETSTSPPPPQQNKPHPHHAHPHHSHHPNPHHVHSHSAHKLHNHAHRHPRHRRTLSNTSDQGDLAQSVDIDTSGLQSSQTADATTSISDRSTARPATAVSGSFLINNASGNPTSSDSPVNNPGTRTESNTAATDAPPNLQGRRQSRGNASTSSFKRTMSSFFRRSNSQQEKPMFNTPDYQQSSSDPTLLEMASSGNSQHNAPTRRWSMHRSLATPQSNSPPSPSTPPLEMNVDSKRHHAPSAEGAAVVATLAPESTSIAQCQTAGMPTEKDFLQNDSKKHRQRAATTLSLHNAIHIVTGATNPLGSRKNKRKPKPDFRRRASSFDHGTNLPPPEIGGELWALPAEAGTGLKARRMSLNLPDDFTVDVVDLHSEFDYQHMLGRHRRHLGKGATSKVTLMFRKGFPDELYAVKEFRGKSSSETREEYEKKVKSEYSLSKSLHHPNIVETVRLCSDHGRWNHVMEYCQEGDMFSLVEKKFLMTPEREKDRLCLFKQLIQGLHYLHSNGIAHRDIKLENLLITSNSKLKITDFGASDVFSGMHPGLRAARGQCGQQTDDLVRLCKPGICGSLPYISPEVLEAKEAYDPRKLDVWAAAIVMLNFIFGGNLWHEARATKDSKDQYSLLVRAWNRYNANHLPARLEAESQYVKKLAAEAENTNKSAEDKAKGGTQSSPGSLPVSSEVNGDAPKKSTLSPCAAALPPDSRPVVGAAPITDGNPNSLVEGPYPSVAVFDQFVNPPVLRRILIHMLNPDPKRRITIHQVMNLRWIRAIECCQPEAYDDPMAPASANSRNVIDASKGRVASGQKIFCHDHLPPKSIHTVSIGRMM